MMLSYEPVTRQQEIKGLTREEIIMYDLAWKHNKDGRGFAGLCDLWYQEIRGSITLQQIQHVWNQLIQFSYFQTDAYWFKHISGGQQNDYIPGSY